MQLKTTVRRGLLVLLLAFVALSILWRGGKGLEATWVLAGIATVVTLASVWLGDFRRDKHRDVPFMLWIGLLLFVAWTGVSLLFSTTQNYGLDEFLRDGACVLLFLWTARHAAMEEGGTFIRRFFSVVTASILIACIAGLLIYVFQPVSRFVGTFLDLRFHTDYWPNAWAEMVLLAWPLAFVATQKWYPFVRILAMGLLLGCLFLSYSRGGLLAFAGQCGLYVLIESATFICSRPILQFIGSCGDLHSSTIIKFTFMVLSAFLIGFAVFSGGNALRSQFFDIESVARKATFTASEGTSSIDERRSFWDAAIVLARERPLFGWGPYSFRFTQPRLQTEVFATSDHPHNVFLKLAMERGVPAALLFAAILAGILGAAVTRLTLRRPRVDSSTGLTTGDPLLWSGHFSTAAIVAIAGVLAHNLIDYNLQFVGIALPFWMLLGILAPTVMLKFHQRNVIRVSALVLAVVIGSVAVLEGKYLVLSSLGRHAEAAGKTEEALQWYEMSQGQFFTRDMHLGRGALLLQKNDLNRARTALARYASQNQEDVRLWVLEGNVELAANDLPAAEAKYEKALESGKFNYLLATEGLLETMGRNPSRQKLIEREALILEVYRKFGEAIVQNVHFIALSDTVEVFERVVVKVRRLYPAIERQYRELAEKALENAAKEREAYGSRAAGMLW